MQRQRIAQALCALLLVIAGPVHADAVVVGSSAPDFALKNVTGKNLRLSEYRGHVVVLSFWAGWCGECRSQLEALADMRAQIDSGEFEVLAVSLDDDAKRTAAAASKVGLQQRVLDGARAEEVARSYDVSTMPSLFLIDRDGIVREVFEGYRRGNETAYLARLRDLLGE
jgi:peroxiredoxin